MIRLLIAAYISAAMATVGAPPTAPIVAPPSDEEVVHHHVAANVNKTFRNASGALPFPYQVPSGYYDQLWDHDAVYMGATTCASFGSGSYFEGSMLNYLNATNVTSGELPGCLTVNGPSKTLAHAKPIIIQGAFLAAKASGDFAKFKAYRPAMEALLAYWEGPVRRHAGTGLHVWWDALETGADDIVFFECPSAYSPECWSDSMRLTMSTPDLETLLHREHTAFALFLRRWGAPEDAAVADRHDALATRIKDAVNELLWHWADAGHTRGWYCGYNVSTGVQATQRTYQAAIPLWAGLAPNASVAAAALAAIQEPDLRTPWGVRSTSSADPRYTNADYITPYSNWRGPIWISVNNILAYTIAAAGDRAAATQLAVDVVHLLAEDVRDTTFWHENYSAEDGSGLASPGFLSWNMMGATLLSNLRDGIDPLALA